MQIKEIKREKEFQNTLRPIAGPVFTTKQPGTKK
jgi:hypothetical protein